MSRNRLCAGIDVFDGASSPPDAPNLPTYPLDAGVRPGSNACSGGKSEDPDGKANTQPGHPG
jgi:hypothetical protein